MSRGRVAALVAEARERHGLSYRDIERAAGISRASLSDYARGNIKQLPPRDRLTALARALRVPLATLLHAFLIDLNLDVLDMPYGELWETVGRSTWLSDEQKRVIQMQLELFQKDQERRHTE